MGPGWALEWLISIKSGGGPKLTDAEANDKHRDGHKSSLVANVEGFRYTRYVRGDDAGAEGDNETCDGHDHGDVPLECLGEVLGVPGIPVREGNQLVILSCLPLWGLGRFLHVELCVLGGAARCLHPSPSMCLLKSRTSDRSNPRLMWSSRHEEVIQSGA